jgi:glycosyltransferase involved in cell wall biosynthesis
VSCSSIYPLKQVDYIARLIFSLKENIEWVHFGDGTDFELVKSITLSAPKNIKCKLMGYVNNQNVMKYYSSNNIDLFISSSKSEGLPVSMMEAISFGIPILAKKVGGVGEIVIDEVTGFCMNPNSTFHEDCNLLLKAINYKFNRNIITNFYSENYNGENNFTKFIQEQLINNSCAE